MLFLRHVQSFLTLSQFPTTMHDTATNNMLIITDILPQRSRTQPRRVRLSDGFTFPISDDTIVRFGLAKGVVVSDEQVREIRSQEETFQAKQAALAICGRRLRSRKELEEKLREKEFSSEAIEAATTFAAEYGYLDDLNFAQAFIRDQVLRRPVGRQRLQLELQRRGVAKQDIAEALSSVFSDSEQELQLAIAAAKKKLATSRITDPQKRERSLANFLAARGFGWEVVRKVIEELK